MYKAMDINKIINFYYYYSVEKCTANSNWIIKNSRYMFIVLTLKISRRLVLIK